MDVRRQVEQLLHDALIVEGYNATDEILATYLQQCLVLFDKLQIVNLVSVFSDTTDHQPL